MENMIRWATFAFATILSATIGACATVAGIYYTAQSFMGRDGGGASFLDTIDQRNGVTLLIAGGVFFVVSLLAHLVNVVSDRG